LVGGLAGYTEPTGAGAAERWFERANERMGGGEWLFFTVCELGDDRFIGTTWLKKINRTDGNAELAIFMDRGHQGKGWGTEVQRVLLDHAFGEMRLERVFLTVSPSNARAIRSYEKVGFTREAVLRKTRLHRGVLEDDVLMSILRSEWATQSRPRSWEIGEPDE